MENAPEPNPKRDEDAMSGLLASALATTYLDHTMNSDLLPRLGYVADLLAAAPTPIDAPSLLFRISQKEVRAVPVGERLRFGRAAECEVNRPDFREVSRLHFTICQEAGSYFLVDSGSANGTFIRGTSTRVIRRELLNGDIIDAGGFTFVFVRG